LKISRQQIAAYVSVRISGGSSIIAEKVDFLSRPKATEGQDPELVDRDDEIPF
jgi:hypothetical protein